MDARSLNRREATRAETTDPSRYSDYVKPEKTDEFRTYEDLMQRLAEAEQKEDPETEEASRKEPRTQGPNDAVEKPEA